MTTVTNTESRWVRGVNQGEYCYKDLVDILFFYSKQVVGSNISMLGEPQDRVIAELDRMDEIVRANKRPINLAY